MDVRAADTSNIAAKQVEFEHVQPVKGRQGLQGRIAAHSTAEANGHVNRPRPPKDPRDEQGGGHGGGHQDDRSIESISAEETEDAPLLVTEEHILDVRV